MSRDMIHACIHASASASASASACVFVCVCSCVRARARKLCATHASTLGVWAVLFLVLLDTSSHLLHAAHVHFPLPGLSL